jgi:NAD(P)-dependent dehydrogenase (short-subunit alcohol dehydrogenase family)
MREFDGRIAVLTGGGSGMGRALARQLTAAGCHLAMCDVSDEEMAETQALCIEGAPPGTRVTTFVADVSDEARVVAFRDFVAQAHGTQHVNLLFNNAGIGGGGSFVLDDRAEWDATFAVCWGGVYACARAFMPMLIASSEGHIVNTSSVNGFWATLGPGIPHTAYSAAKFAVKGFTEALIVDLANNAPHVHASVVMPGHIGTSIVLNSGRYFGREPKEMTEEQVAQARARFARTGLDVGGASDDDIRQGMQMMAEGFRDNAPMTADQAATVILDGVRNGEWRILVGADAELVDRMVRESPVDAYSAGFTERLQARGIFRFAE